MTFSHYGAWRDRAKELFEAEDEEEQESLRKALKKKLVLFMRTRFKSGSTSFAGHIRRQI
jgi:hypothetical protein